jgi:hypothetical protein
MPPILWAATSCGFAHEQFFLLQCYSFGTVKLLSYWFLVWVGLKTLSGMADSVGSVLKLH